MRESPRASQPLVLLTCRPQDSDFRYHLAREMRDLGHPVTYVWLKRQPEITDMATGVSERWGLPRLVRFFAAMRRQRPRPVVFNSTNLAFPGLSALLSGISGARWCLDMHDDLLYDQHGLGRMKAAAAQRLLLATSGVVVHAAPTLARLFPRSHHIGNGSSLAPEPKRVVDERAVLVLASLDRRFDFDLMLAAAEACPDRQFDIHGRISKDDPAVAADLRRLVDGAANIAYHGPYTDRLLPVLLSRYLVAFAPYKVGSRLTDYIDPLRYYHCLASETGLVSTAIPMAQAAGGRIVVIEGVGTLGAALDEAVRRRRGGPLRTWRTVAETLEPILWSARA